MKIYLIFIFLSCSFILCKNPQGPALWSETFDGIRFHIWTDKLTYQPGKDIWLYVEFENVSAKSKVILVGPKQHQSPTEAPLYDIRILITQLKGNGNDKNYNIHPTISSMWNDTPDLFKLCPGQNYKESTKLNSGRWKHKRERFTDLEPGEYMILVIYTWDELPYPSPERVNQLIQLGAPLWNGYLESNEITIRVVLKN